ncbi:DUF3597 family protein [Asticcacaulis taihuensis]|uniref:DUF3597 family protein n=1 Tax=Asticcacaulis taihuensis TaxID=260084 RepID=UPI0034E978ED
MKVCGIDSSLENRKALADELGYTGSAEDSAAMNVWLHSRCYASLRRAAALCRRISKTDEIDWKSLEA